MGWWLRLAPAILEFWVRFPNERNQGKQAHPVLKYRVPHGSQRPRHVVSRSACPPLSPSPHANSSVIGTAVINTHTHVEDQPQYRGLCHSGSPSARSFSRSPSPPPPSFTQYPSPPRSLVRDGQTRPLRPRRVVSRSACPPLSPSPHANSFVIGTAVINTHTKL
jgi:hypothetical protein